jgi:sigma-B regulation protein RsbU (phosphoserine phosphatase)
MEVQARVFSCNDPISPLLDVAGRSNYCDETGGDYYDFIDVAPISKSPLIAVGDVMGHGIPAVRHGDGARRAPVLSTIIARPS